MASYSGNSSSSKAKVTKVKPILKKFGQSEKSSLDLDRPLGEQGFGNYSLESSNPVRSVHDVTFTSTRRGYHARSTSGASHLSTGTAGSGQRTGSFVHPFQQTPQRPYTPPTTSYSGSLSGYARDSANVYEEEDEYPPRNIRSNSTLSSQTASYTPSTSSHLPPLQIPTKSNSSSRLACSGSTSNLHSTLSSVSIDLASPADTISPISGIRSSMDKGFRIRSHSHVDSGTRFETVQEARRAFEAKEQAKADRIAQEEARAAEKRARRLEKAGRKSTTSDGGRSKRSKSDPVSVTHEKQDIFYARDYDMAQHQPAPQIADENFTPPPRSKTAVSTKRKTQSTWMSFVIWLRTRLLRMKKP